MSDLNEALGSAGAGHQFKFGEHELTFMPLTQGMKAAFSSWVVARAREDAIDSELALLRRARRLREEASNLDPDDYNGRESILQDIYSLEETARTQMKHFNDSKTAGEFYFTGRMCLEAMRTMEGTVKLVSLMLKPKHPNLTLAEITEIVDTHYNKIKNAVREVQGLGKSKSPNPSKESGTAE